MRPLTRYRAWLLPLVLPAAMMLGSCAEDAGDGGAADTGAAESAEARFRELEQRLLGAESVLIRAGAGSAGVVVSGLEGEALLASGNRADVQFSGEFGGAAVRLALISDGEQMWGGNGTDSFELEVPAALNEALLLGFTRMGVLHNLALLSTASPPDGTDGTIRDWLTVSNFGWREPEVVDGVATETLSFDLTVHGTPSGQVVLWLDEETGLPVQREQVVQFPDGEMRAVEVYETIDVDELYESDRFNVP